MTTASHSVRIIAVVLNWKDELGTAACVESLLNDEHVDEVVVVDNESEGKVRWLASERVVVLDQEQNLGFSRGVNVGLRAALERGADGVLVINNDAVLGEPGVQPLVATWLEDPTVGMLAPLIMNPDGSEQSTGGRFRPISASTDDLLGGAEPDYLTWACVLVPSSTLRTVGLLDEAFFMYWEDVDYGTRVKRAGLKLRVVSSAHVVHEGSKTHARAGAAIQRYSARGLTYFCLKHGGVAAWIGLPYRIAGRCIRGVASGRDHVSAIIHGVRDGVREYRCSRRLAPALLP